MKNIVKVSLTLTASASNFAHLHLNISSIWFNNAKFQCTMTSNASWRQYPGPSPTGPLLASVTACGSLLLHTPGFGADFGSFRFSSQQQAAVLLPSSWLWTMPVAAQGCGPPTWSFFVVAPRQIPWHFHTLHGWPAMCYRLYGIVSEHLSVCVELC